jgi:hypothetical protein
MSKKQSEIRPRKSNNTLALALGVFSVGIGLIELLAPKKLAQWVGVDDERYSGLIQGMGIREIVNGVGLLAHPGHANAWLWTRVAGDLLDMGLLGAAWSSQGAKKGRLCAAISSVVGVAAADVVATQSFSRYLDEGAIA